MIFNQGFWPIIGSLFHPVYMAANAIILGKLPSYPEDHECVEAPAMWEVEGCITAKQYQSAFGIGSSTISILMLAPSLCYVLALS